MLTLASASGAEEPGADLSGAYPLPKAETWVHEALDPALLGAEGSQRVRITLSSQPVLAMMSRPQIRSAIAPIVRPGSLAMNATASPVRITAAEKRVSREAERGYEAIIATVQDDVKATIIDQREIATRVQALEGEVLERESVPAAIVAHIDGIRLDRLAEHPGVGAITPAPRERPLLDVATPLSGAPSWHGAGFTGGSGEADTVLADLAIIGDAVTPSHPAFVDLDIDNGPQLPDDHGNHVGGVIASRGAAGFLDHQGAAPGIDTLIGAPDDNYALGVTTQAGPGAADPAEVINRSSAGIGSADDNANDREDVLAHIFGPGWTVAAGNANVDGTPSVENVGRNQLSVAAYGDGGTLADISDDVVAAFSSRGPTPAGRKKPDLIAVGAEVTGPRCTGSPCMPAGFDSMSGTSISAPYVASGMALLEGSGVPNAIAQRAILINSSLPWDGRRIDGVRGGQPTTPQTSWQPAVGWGVLNLTGALADRQNYVLGEVREGEAVFYRAATSAGQKATLAWNMRGIWPDFPAPGSQFTTYTVSNLNLRQYNASTLDEIAPPADPGHGGGPDALDDNDNVEQVRAAVATPQTIYKVEAASTVNGAAAEPFALAAAEPLEQLTTPLVEPRDSSATPAGPVGCNTDVLVTTRLRNDSDDLGAESSEVTLDIPAGVELVSGSSSQTVSGGTLEAATTSEPHTWTVRATSSGPKTLTVSGTGSALGTPFTRSERVSFIADCAAPSTSVSAGPAALANDPTPTFAFDTNESGSSFECSLDGGAFAPCTSPKTYGSLPDGSHNFAVRAVDGVGNTGPAATRSFTIDTVAPETELISGPEGPTSETRPAFGFTTDDPVASFACALDRAPFAPCTSPHRTLALADGAHTYRVRAVDPAGNADPTPGSRDFRLDTEVDFKAKARDRQQVARSAWIRLKLGAREPIRATIAGAIIDSGDRYPLAKEQIELGEGERARLDLEPSRAADARKILKLLEAGEQMRAEIRVKARDELGNRGRVDRSVELGRESTH